MKKQIAFIFRYLTTRRWRRWLNLQTILILLLAVILLSAMAWFTPSTPLLRGAHNTAATSIGAVAANTVGAATPTEEAQETAAPNVPPTRTPLPPEYLHNANQTVGIAFAGAGLVLIIVLGVALFSPREG